MEKKLTQQELMHKRADNLALEIRGQMIHYWLNVELVANAIIAQYFCETPERREDFLYVILEKQTMTMSAKFEILGFIIRNYLPEFLKKYPNYLTDFENLMSLRNDMAHRQFLYEPPEKGVIGTMYFVHLKTTKGVKKRKETELTPEFQKQTFDGLSTLINQSFILLDFFEEKFHQRPEEKPPL